MSDLSARLGLPYLMPAQAQKHVTHNEALALLDLLVQLTVQDFDAAIPPAMPLAGQVWALGPAPSGDWAGQGGQLAVWLDGAWLFVTPQAGWRAAAVSAQGVELRLFTDAGWVVATAGAPDIVPGLGVNTGHDATNRLAVASDAVLLTHDGAGHQLKINKAEATETGSLLFQTGWSGRAEMGTAGTDDWSLKVSADGATWHDALVIDRNTGKISAENGLSVTGLLAGTAVTQSATDSTAGRIPVMRTAGIFGLAAQTPEELTDLNEVPRSGINSFVSGAANAPFDFGSVLHLPRRSGALGQIAIRVLGSNAPTAPQLAVRTSSGVAGAFDFGPWAELYHRLNVVGTVSQSGGVPTGAVIQRGSNSNGDFVRFADGTQICQSRVGDIAIEDADNGWFRSAAFSWTFPAAFVASTETRGAHVFGRVSSANGLFVNTPYGDRTTNASGIRAYARVSTESAQIFLTAIGRWF